MIHQRSCYLCSEKKGADQLRGYREADLRFCFRICKMQNVGFLMTQLIYTFDDDDDCFKVAQASRHSGYPLLPNRDSYFSHSCTTTWQPE